MLKLLLQLRQKHVTTCDMFYSSITGVQSRSSGWKSKILMMCLHSRQQSRGETVYQDDDGDGTSEAPDEFVIDGDPAEVGVPVSLWVQAHCQACSQEGGKETAPWTRY